MALPNYIINLSELTVMISNMFEVEQLENRGLTRSHSILLKEEEPFSQKIERDILILNMEFIGARKDVEFLSTISMKKNEHPLIEEMALAQGSNLLGGRKAFSLVEGDTLSIDTSKLVGEAIGKLEYFYPEEIEEVCKIEILALDEKDGSVLRRLISYSFFPADITIKVPKIEGYEVVGDDFIQLSIPISQVGTIKKECYYRKKG